MTEGERIYPQYPPALAKYDDVVGNPKVFMDTLEKLHALMGTKFMVPIIGGKELDLHRLFVEVTARGGIVKILKDKRWKDVTAVFNFPSTATNASFILRKYYISLIHHYEQIYFFGSRVWTPPPAVSLPAPCSTAISAQGSLESMGPSSETRSASQKRRRSAGELLPGANPSSSSGCPVTGVIDGKFEHGYLVTVTVGTQKLKGVLYHTPEHLPVAHVSNYSGAFYNVNSADATVGVRRRRRRKKSEMKKRDPWHPKPNRSGYNFFFAEQHARLKSLHPGKDREISKMIGDLWNKLTESEKAVYQERGVKDKERYLSEMEEYRERLKAGPIIAVPIQQRLALPDSLSNVDCDPRMEIEGPLLETLENHSGSDGSETDEEKDDDIGSDEEEFPEAGTTVEVCHEAVGPSVDEDGLDSGRRDQGGKVSDVEDSRGTAANVGDEAVDTVDGDGSELERKDQGEKERNVEDSSTSGPVESIKNEVVVDGQ